MKTPASLRILRLPAWLAAGALLLTACGSGAQRQASVHADEAEAARRVEGQVPPPPAYSTQGLIAIQPDASSASVRMGIDPSTITLDKHTGIVRYVIVMQSASAHNASYEGIRCRTGEYRVYARQSQGQDWTPQTDSHWRPMRGQSQVIVRHPSWLAANGVCMGRSARDSVPDIVRALRTGNASAYL